MSIDAPLPNIQIIDNFYDDLSDLIPWLHNQEFQRFTNVNYAGIVYGAPHEMKRFALNKLQKTLDFDKEIPVDRQGEIRLTTKDDENNYRTFVHCDESFNMLIYLSGEEGEQNGTFFYKHKDLRITRTPEDDLTRRKMNMLLEHDSKVLSKWEVVANVPFKPNRAVLFNGRYFHSVPPRFHGNNLETGRLTQHFFLNHLYQFRF